jgi:hypothetical protein
MAYLFAVCQAKHGSEFGRALLQVLTWIVYAKSKEYGEKYVLMYSSLCALIASWTVLGCKAFMAFFRLTVEKGNNQVCGSDAQCARTVFCRMCM